TCALPICIGRSGSRTGCPVRPGNDGGTTDGVQAARSGRKDKKMKIYVTSVLVEDQAKALDLYRDTPGFQVKHDIDMGGGARWLTMVSPENPGGTELLLEPSEHPAARPFQEALVADGIPFTSFMVDDMAAEVEKLKAKGVRFTLEPMDAGTVLMAVFDDTCGNLIQIVQMKG